MITIRTRDYTTEQLKYLEEGLSYASRLIVYSSECQKYSDCTTACKDYAICNDLFNTWRYLCKKIKERESLELHRDMQESK